MPDRNEAKRVALVLGATGGIGGEMSRQLRAAGWTVRALHRRAAQQQQASASGEHAAGIEWLQGDAMSRADVMGAAAGARLIVHAVNPPGYRRWSELVLPMIDNTIAAARASGARIVLPGTVYNFGPEEFDDLRETSPQRPQTTKGAIRAEMEVRLRAATAEGVRTLIVRAGDFFGPGAANNWFSQGLVKPGKRVTSVTYPGRAGVGHQWAYLPDVARTMMTLLARESLLDDFAVFHMKGHWDPDGTAMTAAIGRAVGRERLRVRGFPWGLVRATAWAVPLFRELQEMRYLWERPLSMTNDRLVGFLGHEPCTPLDEAVRTTLQGLGCLNAAAAAASEVTAPAAAPRRFA